MISVFRIADLEGSAGITAVHLAAAMQYRRGDIAEAELAVPGWTLPVDDLFD